MLVRDRISLREMTSARVRSWKKTRKKPYLIKQGGAEEDQAILEACVQPLGNFNVKSITLGLFDLFVDSLHVAGNKITASSYQEGIA